MLLVVALKHVLVLHEPEQHHGLVKDRLHLLFRQLLKGIQEKTMIPLTPTDVPMPLSAATYPFDSFLQLIINEQ